MWGSIHTLARKPSWARSICTSKYRYTFYPSGHGWQLVNLEANPHEQKNLVNNPKHASLHLELKDRLMEKIILYLRLICFGLVFTKKTFAKKDLVYGLN